MKLVKYDSKMNELNFGKFKEKELDLFFSICYKMKEEDTKEVTISFSELKQLSNYSNRNLDRFVKDLSSTYDKLIDIKIKLETKDIITKFVLFTYYEIDKNNREVTIKVNEKFKFILNDISKFTKFDLLEFVQIKSSYAKNIFKILKQYESNSFKQKWLEIQSDEFRELLNVPQSYKAINIDKRILEPVLEQLEPFFKNLKIEKIKKGRKIEKYKFYWESKEQKKEKYIQGVIKKFSSGEKELEDHMKKLENDKEVPVEKIYIQKEIVTKEQFEELYQEHLKKYNVDDNPILRKFFLARYEIKEV